MAYSMRADSSRVLWRLASSSSSCSSSSSSSSSSVIAAAAATRRAAVAAISAKRLIVARFASSSSSTTTTTLYQSSRRFLSSASSPSLRPASPCESLRRSGSSVGSRHNNNSNNSSYPFRLVTRAGWGDPVVWSKATVASRVPAVPEPALSTTAPLHLVTLDVGKGAAALYTTPGQYLQIRIAKKNGGEGEEATTKPGFFAIASAPSPNSSTVELLVKATGNAENTADALASASAGDAVEVSPVAGKGFAIDRIPASEYHTVLLFATGTGISPIRAAIASGLLNGGSAGGKSAKRRDVRLYYGTRSRDATAFAAEAEGVWRAAGVRVVPVYSDEGDDYVQDVFAKELGAVLESSEGEKGPVFSATLPEGAPGLTEAGTETAALLCGHRGMCDSVKALLAAAGVSPEAVLMNF